MCWVLELLEVARHCLPAEALFSELEAQLQFAVLRYIDIYIYMTSALPAHSKVFIFSKQLLHICQGSGNHAKDVSSDSEPKIAVNCSTRDEKSTYNRLSGADVE